MRIEQLQYLTEISRTHSFRAAAEILFVTQPALSESIKKLEKELGVVLLERTPNGVYPTAVGLEIVEISQRILADARLIERNARAILEAVALDRCDLGLAVLREPTMLEMERGAKFQVERIRPVQLYLVVQGNSYLAQRKNISLKEISTMRLALHSADDADFAMIDDTIFENVQKPQVIFRSDDMQLINERLQQENIGTIYNGLRLEALPVGLAAIAINEVDDLYMWYVFQKDTVCLDRVRYVMDLLDAEVFKRSENQ